jgi:hypothetical protein
MICGGTETAGASIAAAQVMRAGRLRPRERGEGSPAFRLLAVCVEYRQEEKRCDQRDTDSCAALLPARSRFERTVRMVLGRL